MTAAAWQARLSWRVDRRPGAASRKRTANREAGDEGEIDRVAEGPALKKANQLAQGNLKRQYDMTN
jgi:hypothetical protein